MYTANAIRNVCLLGHSGSGKSALAESLLYMTGAIVRMGKNADGNTVCDYDPERFAEIFLSLLPSFLWITRMHGLTFWMLPAVSTLPALLWKLCVLPTLLSLSALPRTVLPLVLRRLGNTVKSGTCPVSSTSPR